MTVQEIDSHLEVAGNDEGRESGLFYREFRADLQVGDGRTVDVRIVPYGERITHNDGLGGVPRGVEYQEEFLPGAFNHQLNAANRVLANVEHEKGIAGRVGHGVMLREMPDGLHGTFRLLETPAGETARQLIQAGALDGISLEAGRVKDVRGPNGLIQRAKVNLTGIAFTAYSAYKNARILALREEEELDEPQVLDADLLVSDLDPRLVERCRRLGLTIPQRYDKAHPAPGTPDTSGTPEDDTRRFGDHYVANYATQTQSEE